MNAEMRDPSATRGIAITHFCLTRRKSVVYDYNCSRIQSTLLLTRYTCTNVFPSAENNSGTPRCRCCSRTRAVYFHLADISRTCPFHLAFHTMAEESVA